MIVKIFDERGGVVELAEVTMSTGEWQVSGASPVSETMAKLSLGH